MNNFPGRSVNSATVLLAFDPRLAGNARALGAKGGTPGQPQPRHEATLLGAKGAKLLSGPMNPGSPIQPRLGREPRPTQMQRPFDYEFDL